MNGPDTDLMEFYGTKEAGARAASALMQLAASRTTVRGMSGHLSRLREQAELLNEQARMIEVMRMQAATGGFSGTRAPAFISPGGIGPYGYPVPVGMDGGMVRLASAEAGKSLAKGLGTKLRRGALNAVTLGGTALGVGSLAAGKALDAVKENVLEGPTAGLPVPIRKFGSVGGTVVEGLSELPKRIGRWGKKGLSKTTLRGTLAGAAVAGGALGAANLGKKGIDLMSTEVKPYSYATGGFRPPTTPSPYGYVTPAAPRY